LNCVSQKGITWEYNDEKRIGFNPKSANWGKIGNNIERGKILYKPDKIKI
jgi:hypothetical protein